jgi:hypothetical protein
MNKEILSEMIIEAKYQHEAAKLTLEVARQLLDVDDEQSTLNLIQAAEILGEAKAQLEALQLLASESRREKLRMLDMCDVVGD